MKTTKEHDVERQWTAVRNVFRRSRRRVRTAVAFGSGGARGWAHAGVMKAFREIGFKPDLVVGTSIGSIAAAVQAAGVLDDFLKFSEDLDWFKATQMFIEFGIPRGGLIEGRKVADLLGKMIPVERIEDLSLPYAAVAADLETAEPVVFTSGSLIEAIRASISIPGVFTPVRFGKRLLVDGGIVNPLPIETARAMGATRVIAVNINNNHAAPEPETETETNDGSRPGNLADLLQQQMMRLTAKVGKLSSKRHRTESDSDPGMNLFDVLTRAWRIAEDRLTQDCIRANPPDILIEPAVGDIATMDFSRAAVAIKAGHDATLAAMKDWS
ncbi:MAG: patatin-like phospholipase family protein [Kiritimatiellia bacterium]